MGAAGAATNIVDHVAPQYDGYVDHLEHAEATCEMSPWILPRFGWSSR
jgi:hypothetical protein